MAEVLILDDDKKFASKLARATGAMGHEIIAVETLMDAWSECRRVDFDVVFVDSLLPGIDNLSVIKKLTALPSRPEVIVFSDKPTPDEAEQVIRAGAWDYMQRPKSPKILTLPLTRALEYRSKKSSGQDFAKARQRIKFEGVKGSSPEMVNCLDLAVQAAKSDSPVLICGETGTGKELFASAIHEHSHRSGKKFVVVDCAALPPNLVESTIFGHKKGAFTNADRDQSGLIKQADGGTLFLDEVGELPVDIQTSFLRVLEERSYRPVGAAHEFKSDFRLIAATNRDLDEMARHGDYRSDLIYRLKTFTLLLPPLRRRMDDLEELVVFHLNKIFQNYGFSPKTYSEDFISALKQYEWPGNIRELVNVLEAAAAAAGDEPVLFPKHLPVGVRVRMVRGKIESTESQGENPIPIEMKPSSEELPPLQEVRDRTIARVEKEYLIDLLDRTGGKTRKAVEISGLSRSRFYALLKKHGISTKC